MILSRSTGQVLMCGTNPVNEGGKLKIGTSWIYTWNPKIEFRLSLWDISRKWGVKICTFFLQQSQHCCLYSCNGRLRKLDSGSLNKNFHFMPAFICIYFSPAEPSGDPQRLHRPTAHVQDGPGQRRRKTRPGLRIRRRNSAPEVDLVQGQGCGGRRRGGGGRRSERCREEHFEVEEPQEVGPRRGIVLQSLKHQHDLTSSDQDQCQHGL